MAIMKLLRYFTFTGLITLLWMPHAHATFHLVQIEQVIGGVNGDTTAQAIQLRMRANGQDLLAQGKFVVFDATGANPITLDITANVVNDLAGDRVLIATPNFASHTTPAAVPDFTFTTMIPASYLAAGSLAWENDAGTQILWRLSWGGATYTGSTTGQITNDADGQFGPAWPGALPSSNLTALDFSGGANALSSNNAADYEISESPVSFENNAGNTFTVMGGAAGPSVTITASDATATETAGNTGQFTITRNPVSTTSLVVRYTVSGTAVNGSDYNRLNGTNTIPANAASSTITVTPRQNTTAECTETVIATLAADAAYTVGTPSSATVTITDDDLTTVNLSTPDATASESPVTDTGRLSVRRTGCTNNALVVTYMVGGTATSGMDYRALSGIVTMNVNAATANITVRAVDDTVVEPVETVTVQILPGAIYQLGTNVVGTVNINSNE